MPPTSHTVVVHYNSQNNYTITPRHTDVDPGDTVLFTAEVQDATVCFSPSNTLFGASVNVYVSGTPAASFSVPSNAPSITVTFCATALNSTCVPAGPTGTLSGSIKVG